MAKNKIELSCAFSGTNKAGQTVYPTTMTNRKTGEYGFRVTPPSKGNTVLEALTVSEARMVELVKDHNYQVRCRPVGVGEPGSLFASTQLKFSPSYTPLSS